MMPINMITDKDAYMTISSEDKGNVAFSQLEDVGIDERGLPKYPSSGLEMSPHRLNYIENFVKNLQGTIYELEQAIVPIIVSGFVTLESLNYILSNTQSLIFEWKLKILPKQLKYSVLYCMCSFMDMVKEVKLLFEELLFLKKLLYDNKAKLDSFDIEAELDKYMQFYCKEMSLFLAKSTHDAELVKSSIDGFNEELASTLDEYSKHLIGNRSTINLKGKQHDEFDEVYFYKQYEFNIARYEGYTLRHEEFTNILFRLRSSKEDAKHFSFDLLTKLVDGMLGLLTPLFEINSLSEHSHRRIDKRREKMENGEKLFNDKLLDEVYPIVNARIINAIPYEYFADCMNNPFPPTHMSVTNDKLQDACYFIRSMSMALPYDERKKWVDRMKVVLNIKNSTYQSKRYFSGSGQASEESRAFVRDLNNVLQENGIEI